jgi:hypothetical protein
MNHRTPPPAVSPVVRHVSRPTYHTSSPVSGSTQRVCSPCSLQLYAATPTYRWPSKVDACRDTTHGSFSALASTAASVAGDLASSDTPAASRQERFMAGRDVMCSALCSCKKKE